MSRAVREQSGIVLPVVLMVLVAVLALVLVAATTATTTQHQSLRDSTEKQALGAADAGVQMATGWLSRVQPSDDECITDGSDGTPMHRAPAAAGAHWCGGFYWSQLDKRSWAIVRISVGEDHERTIVASGMANCAALWEASDRCLTRTITATVRTDPTRVGSDLAVWIKHDLTLSNDAKLEEFTRRLGGVEDRCTMVFGASPDDPDYCGAKVQVGRNVTIGGDGGICGLLRMRLGGVYTRNSGDLSDAWAYCLRGDPPVSNGYSTFEPDADFEDPPDVRVPSNIDQTSADCKLTRISYGAGEGCDSSGDSMIGSVDWDRDAKSLVIWNGGEVTLSGGIYNFCYLEVWGNGKLTIADTGRPTVIYIESPDSPPAGRTGCPSAATPVPTQGTLPAPGWGSFRIGSGGTVLTPGASGSYRGAADKLVVRVEGSETKDTDQVLFGSGGRMRFTLEAPNSLVRFKGQPVGLTQLTAEDFVSGGNYAVEWDDQASKVEIPTPYERQSWFECRSRSTWGSLAPALWVTIPDRPVPTALTSAGC